MQRENKASTNVKFDRYERVAIYMLISGRHSAKINIHTA